MDQVVGHDEIIRELKRQITGGSGNGLLIAGPIGSGKTLFAELYAKALLCESANAVICDQCEACLQFELGRDPSYRSKRDSSRPHPNYWPVICRDGSEPNFDNDYAYPTYGNGMSVVLIDNAECLSKKSVATLYERLKYASEDRRYVLCVSEIEQVPHDIRSVCTRIQVRPLSLRHRTELLRRWCETSGTECEVGALELLADRAGHNCWSLLTDWEAIAAGRRVLTVALVQAHYGRERRPYLDRYFTAVATNEDVSLQLQALEDWPESPARKRELIEEALSDLFRTEVVGLRSRNCALDMLFPETARLTVLALTDCATRVQLRPWQIWTWAVGAWHAEGAVSDAWVQVHALSFAGLLRDGAPTSPVRPTQTSPAGERESGRSRRISRARAFAPLQSQRAGQASKPASTALSATRAQALWEAASFLVQEHGVLLNSHIVLRHDKLGSTENYKDLISSLIHELGQRVRPSLHRTKLLRPRLQGEADESGFNWLYAHETSERHGLCSHIVAHLPADVNGVQDWLIDSLLRRRLGGHTIPPHATNVTRATRRTHAWCYHVQLVRLMCRNVDRHARLPVTTATGKVERFSLAHLLGLDQHPRVERAIAEVPKRKPCGWSESLGEAARARAQRDRLGPLSIFANLSPEAVSEFASGWECVEHEHRQAERATRRAAIDRINIDWPEDHGEQSDLSREAALNKLRASWPADPLMRLRSEHGWWTARRRLRS